MKTLTAIVALAALAFLGCFTSGPTGPPEYHFELVCAPTPDSTVTVGDTVSTFHRCILVPSGADGG